MLLLKSKHVALTIRTFNRHVLETCHVLIIRISYRCFIDTAIDCWSQFWHWFRFPLAGYTGMTCIYKSNCWSWSCLCAGDELWYLRRNYFVDWWQNMIMVPLEYRYMGCHISQRKWETLPLSILTLYTVIVMCQLLSFSSNIVRKSRQISFRRCHSRTLCLYCFFSFLTNYRFDV